MPFKTYIIRFPNERSRSAFQRAVKNTGNINSSQMEFGEFLPDIIVRHISDQAFKEIKRIADPDVRFIEDFQHDLLRP